MRTLALIILGIFVLTIPVENIIIIANGSVTKLIGILSLFVGLAALSKRDVITFKPPSLFLTTATLFVLWGALTYYWSFTPGISIARTITFVQLLAMSWLIWEFGRTTREREFLLQMYIVGAYISLIIALNYFFSDTGFRNFGEGLNANDFAVVLALGIPMAWRLTFAFKNNWLYLVNLLYLPLAITGIVVAASRGGMIAALIALTIVPFTFNKLKPLRKLGLFAFLALGLWSIFVYAPKVFPELQASTARLSETSYELRQGSLTGRRNIWAAGLQVFADHPYVGIGQGGFAEAVRPIYGRAITAHNAYLGVLVNTGIIGLSLFLLIIAAIFVPAFIGRFPQRTFVLITLATLLVSIFSLSADSYKYTWFVLALLASEVPVMTTVDQGRRVAMANSSKLTSAAKN